MSHRTSEGRLRQEFRRFDPGRSPQWGWQFALRCQRTGERPLEKFDGYWPCEAVRLARAFGLSEEDQDFVLTKRHRRQWHTIRDAYHLWQTNGPQRWAVEARILAKQTDAEIAATEQLGEDVVQAYEALFFQVRDKLRFTAYIHEQILELDRQWTGRDVSKVWGFFGYHAGRRVLQEFIDDFKTVGKPDYSHLQCEWFTNFEPSCAKRWLYWSIQERLLPQVLSKERTLQLSEFNIRLIFAESLSMQSQNYSQPEPLDLLLAGEKPVGLGAARRIS